MVRIQHFENPMIEIRRKAEINKQIELQYLITLITKINQLCKNDDLYSSDSVASIKKCKRRFIREMYWHMRKSKSLSCSKFVDDAYFEIKSFDLRSKYQMEFSEKKQRIYLFLMGVNYSWGTQYSKLKLATFKYNEYKRAVNLIEQINDILTKERECKKNRQLRKNEIENSKIIEMNKSSVESACLFHKDSHIFFNYIFSDYQGCILISPDGNQLFIIFIDFSKCENNIQTVLELCSEPKSLSVNNIECVPICSSSIDYDRLKKIESFEEILQAIYGDVLLS